MEEAYDKEGKQILSKGFDTIEQILSSQENAVIYRIENAGTCTENPT